MVKKLSKILVTDPGHDDTTRLLSAWITSTSEYINNLRTHEVIGLMRADVNKDSFTDAFDIHSPSLVLFNGHGTEHKLYGHNDVAIVESHETENERYRDAIFYALACKAAKGLGPHLIDKGATAFIGYKEDFQFYDSVTNGQNPLTDPVSSLFLEPAYLVSKSLADGKTAGEAHKVTQKMYADNFRNALAINMPTRVLASLAHNIKNHVVLGDVTAQI